jgi:LuxR family maltose regulon positive regulatory protein
VNMLIVGPESISLRSGGSTVAQQAILASPFAGLRTKLVRPRLPSDHVVRPRLLRLLDRGLERRLTLVSAPAGFGKTTLLSAWNPPGHAVAWLAFEEGDADLGVFARMLANTLHAAVPDLSAHMLSLLNLAELPEPSTLAAHLADDLASQRAGIVIVLDDYHVVQGEAIYAFIRHLIARLPGHAHLVISTREDPPLPTATLRARDELVQIRFDQLAFTMREARAFLARALPTALSADAAGRLDVRLATPSARLTIWPLWWRT